jgi:hypothetical protein
MMLPSALFCFFFLELKCPLFQQGRFAGKLEEQGTRKMAAFLRSKCSPGISFATSQFAIRTYLLLTLCIF